MPNQNSTSAEPINGKETEAIVALTPALTPVELLRIAVSQNADIDKLTKLMDLQERWERNEARKAFVVAMNAFKSAPPTISKNKQVSFQSAKGPVDYKHATLDHVCDAVIGGLSKHGISHRWKVEQTTEWITVTCILTHELGHSEETKLMGAPDNSGSKNTIQAIGSTVTYLERYTLLAATGLAAAGTDDDAQASTNFGDVSERLEWLANSKDLAELRQIFAAAYRDARRFNDQEAMKRIVEAKDKRKRELR